MAERLIATPYNGTKIWENGTTDSQWFSEYTDMCEWLAEHPEAGIHGTDGGVPIDQEQLQQDVSMYQ